MAISLSISSDAVVPTRVRQAMFAAECRRPPPPFADRNARVAWLCDCHPPRQLSLEPIEADYVACAESAAVAHCLRQRVHCSASSSD